MRTKLGFVERLRATSAGEKWASKLTFPGVTVKAANGAHRAMVNAYVRGWAAARDAGVVETTAFEEFAAEFIAALPEEVREHDATNQSLWGLGAAFRAGWHASKRRELGMSA